MNIPFRIWPYFFFLLSPSLYFYYVHAKNSCILWGHACLIEAHSTNVLARPHVWDQVGAWLTPTVTKIKVFFRNSGHYSGGEPFGDTWLRQRARLQCHRDENGMNFKYNYYQHLFKALQLQFEFFGIRLRNILFWPLAFWYRCVRRCVL